MVRYYSSVITETHAVIVAFDRRVVFEHLPIGRGPETVPRADGACVGLTFTCWPPSSKRACGASRQPNGHGARAAPVVRTGFRDRPKVLRVSYHLSCRRHRLVRTSRRGA
jgi:hypothetical protein